MSRSFINSGPYQYIRPRNSIRIKRSALQESYDKIVNENQEQEQILYKSLYENLLSQINNYVADIETVLSKLKILLNSDLPTERNISDKQTEENNVIEFRDDNTNIIEEDLVE